MKKTLTRIFIFALNIGTAVLVFNSASVRGTDEHGSVFSAADAVSKVIREHPDFPYNTGKVIIEKLPTGGPSGTTANVKFTTKVRNSGKERYIVTLTKDWGITVNGKYAISSWKYAVTPDSVTLAECIDNDYLPNMMK